MEPSPLYASAILAVASFTVALALETACSTSPIRDLSFSRAVWTASAPRPTASCVPWRTASRRLAISSAAPAAAFMAPLAASVPRPASATICAKIRFMSPSRAWCRWVASAMVSEVKIAANTSQ
ncbi:hypothetical protein GO304_05085 [Ralstonia solanacearum]|nr:hypothetical protein [Ralstonia solanacearum]NJZ81000.1 hypothetical protein [Ralstonia solanacearum]NKA37124.1 hypothetical protein [Ralstonia solanacearum]NKF82774.1 hypothetical protein [Ralstonia solanacearum]